MAITANIQNAMRIFKYNPNATKWLPKTSLKNATVSFEKTANGIQKVVTRNDGQVITGHYTFNGELTGAIQKSRNGWMETFFGGQGYDKVISIHNNKGESITRLGHRNNPNRYLDTYVKNGRQIWDDNAFNRLKNEVQSAKKMPQWLEELTAQWK